MREEYTYAELCRMTKKRVIRIAGFINMKDLLRSNFNRESMYQGGKVMDYIDHNPSKKYIANIIASDR